MKDLLTRTEIITLINEAFGDNYKMSAPRAKSIEKIKTKLGGNKGASGSGKGFTSKYGENPDIIDYDAMLDNFFKNGEILKKHVVEEPQNGKIYVEEFYYDDTNTILMIVRMFKDKEGKILDNGSVIIKPSLYEEIRKSLNIGKEKYPEILKKYLKIKSIIKNPPYEKLEDLLGIEKRIIKKPVINHCEREDIIQSIDKYMTNLNLKELKGDKEIINNEYIGKIETNYTYYSTQEDKLIYTIETVINSRNENIKKLYLDRDMVRDINEHINDSNIDEECIINNIKNLLKVDEYDGYLNYKSKLINRFNKFKDMNSNLQEELKKIKHMNKVMLS